MRAAAHTIEFVCLVPKNISDMPNKAKIPLHLLQASKLFSTVQCVFFFIEYAHKKNETANEQHENWLFFLLNNANSNKILLEIIYCGSKSGNEEEKKCQPKKMNR